MPIEFNPIQRIIMHKYKAIICYNGILQSIGVYKKTIKARNKKDAIRIFRRKYKTKEKFKIQQIK